LQRQQSAAHPFIQSEPAARLEALPLAVLICAHSFHQFARFDRLPWLRWRMFWWKRALKHMDFAQELAAFKDHVLAGTSCFRVNPPDQNGQPGRTLGTPLLLSLHQFVLRLPEAEIQHYGPSSWDYPYALAQMRYAAVGELDGRLEVENDAERQAREAAEQWEREHPESTLKFVNKKEVPCPQ
jgi:hypothetical protein